MDYLKKDIERHAAVLSDKKAKCFSKFRSNLLEGINYYKKLIPEITNRAVAYRQEMMAQMEAIEERLS